MINPQDCSQTHIARFRFSSFALQEQETPPAINWAGFAS